MVALVRQGGRLADQTSEGAQVDKEIGAGDVGGSASEAVGPDALEVESLDLTVAAFGGVATAAIARLPGGRAEGEEAGQAGVRRAIGMDEGRGHVPGHSARSFGVTVGTLRRGLRLR